MLYRSILEHDPTYAHAHLNLDFMRCEFGEFDAAASLYKKGLRFFPTIR
ncbi:Tfp pilus assembly protein PilF [Variovorax boronicumulans]|nr:hypothetical protein [Variovorax boronicumulans]MDH6165522.1 Tfp pilus assembly protein PilF [Variovorax boronicumulans]